MSRPISSLSRPGIARRIAAEAKAAARPEGLLPAETLQALRERVVDFHNGEADGHAIERLLDHIDAQARLLAVLTAGIETAIAARQRNFAAARTKNPTRGPATPTMADSIAALAALLHQPDGAIARAAAARLRAKELRDAAFAILAEGRADLTPARDWLKARADKLDQGDR